MNGSPERGKPLVKLPDRRGIREIDIAHNVHPGIRFVRKVVELGGNQIGHVTNRICGP